MVRTVANTPLRSFRIADDVYTAAQVQAEADGTSVSAVIVQMLKAYGAVS
jgi:predicted HicB family RNase H-like nuclease